MTTTEPGVVTLDDALQAIRTLRLELAELRAGLATEVRTKRLVVVDEQGREAIYTQFSETYANLVVEFPFGDGDHSTCEVHLTASGPGESMGVVGGAGVFLMAGSECAGNLQVERSFEGDPDRVAVESTLELVEQTDDYPARTPRTRRRMHVQPRRIFVGGDHYSDVRRVAKFAKPAVTT